MIHKESCTTLRKMGQFYTTLCSDVVKNIRNPDSLAIWTYLQSQSCGFKIRATHLQKHFHIGQIRYNAAMKLLKESRLIHYDIIRNKLGQIEDRIMECYSLPYEDKGIEAIHAETSTLGEEDNPNASKNLCMGEAIPKQNEELIKDQGSLIKKKKENKGIKPLSKGADKNSEIKTLCSRLKLKGISGASPLNAELIALLNEDVSADHILIVADEAVERDKKSLGWITATIIGRRDDAKKLSQKTKAEPKQQKPTPIHPPQVEYKAEPMKREKAPPLVLAMLEEKKKMLSMPKKDVAN